jgi:hypothetical protein
LEDVTNASKCEYNTENHESKNQDLGHLQLHAPARVTHDVMQSKKKTPKQAPFFFCPSHTSCCAVSSKENGKHQQQSIAHSSQQIIYFRATKKLNASSALDFFSPATSSSVSTVVTR